ncbi:hypothetical protein D3C87_1892480 [compost metagenome]
MNGLDSALRAMLVFVTSPTKRCPSATVRPSPAPWFDRKRNVAVFTGSVFSKY